MSRRYLCTVPDGPGISGGLPAAIAKASEDGCVTGSPRGIARKFNVGKGTVQRAHRLVREYAEA